LPAPSDAVSFCCSLHTVPLRTNTYALPRDRSFLYSLLIGAVAVPLHSLHALVVAQSLAGVASAFFVYLIVRVFLGVRYEAALIAALLVAIEPGQLFYERMVMAEAFGSAIWLGFLVLVLAYVRDGRTIWLPAIALAGIMSVAFRLNGTAVVLLIAPCLPLWRAWFTDRAETTSDERSAQRRRVALQLAVSVAMTLVLHVGYRHIVSVPAPLVMARQYRHLLKPNLKHKRIRRQPRKVAQLKIRDHIPKSVDLQNRSRPLPF